MDNKIGIDRKYGNGILTLVMVMLFMFFIVQTLFNTKGEPREAIVAVSMLNSGNWILPQSFGTDIPYKPPFLAWCIAAFSWLLGGEVTECTSRLPSVVAAIVMILAINRFFRGNSRSQMVGAATAWVTLSSIEVFRAATACRVDMVLTMFMVCAMFALYTFFKRGCKGFLPWWAILLMSGAVLTKGPVGMVLPCLALGVFRLCEGDRFWPLFGRLALSGVLACVIPAAWYYAAYLQGGESFKELAMEENFGRMTGTMSYESHFNPAYYNLITLATGMLPYTLLAVMALFVVRWKAAGEWVKSLRSQFAAATPLTKFAIVVALVVLVFYTIPKSKRSVYLLPMYPFLAYFIVLLVGWLSERHIKVMKVFTRVMAALAVAVPVVYIVMISGAADHVKAVERLGFAPTLRSEVIGILLGALCVFIGIGSWRGASQRLGGDTPRFFGGIFGDASMSIFAVYIMLNIAVLPTLLSAKSDRYVAADIEQHVGAGETVYSHVEAPMLRFFTVNFYMRDNLRVFESEMPRKGTLLVGEKDFEELKTRYKGRYRFKKVYEGTQKSCDVKQIPILVQFFRLK